MSRHRRRRRSEARRTAPGQPPGSLTADPEALPSAVHAIAFGPDSVHETPVSDPEQLSALRGHFPVLWVNIDGLGDARLIERLGAIFGLHPLALEDVLHVHQRAKVDRYDDYLFIVARMVNRAERLDTEQLSLFLGRDFVLSFQERPGDSFDPVRDRIRTGQGRVRSAAPDYLAYRLLDATLDAYFPVLEQYGDALEELEIAIMARPSRKTFAAVHDMKRDLLGLRRAVWPQREALSALVRDPTPLVSDETRLYLRDLYDHSIQLIDLVENYRELGSGLTDLYLSSLSNRMNEVMKVLTIISTIFIPLTFIVGVYGMNFEYMPELHSRWGYPAVWVVMIVIALAMLRHFRKLGWIGNGDGSDGSEDRKR